MSIKRIYLTRRNPAISAADFPREWRRHAALAASFSNVNRRYTRVAQCTKAEGLPVQPQNDYSGVALLWMESLAVALEVNNDPQIIERLRPDEVRVFGMEVTHCAMFTEETVLLDGPAAGFVVIEFLMRAPALSKEEFARQWQAHASTVLSDASVKRFVRRYAQDLVVQQPPPGYEFDGVSEMWFDSMEDAVALLNDPAYVKGVQEARAAFCDLDRTVLMPTKVTHAWAAG
ncbi:hypothetical protein BH11PSE7_BH11PSE7_24460 [soil metagenome]